MTVGSASRRVRVPVIKGSPGVQQRPSLNSVSYQAPKYFYTTGNRVPYSNAMQACITIGRITI
eukprot:34886-Prymnesium_polylepis.1